MSKSLHDRLSILIVDDTKAHLKLLERQLHDHCSDWGFFEPFLPDDLTFDDAGKAAIAPRLLDAIDNQEIDLSNYDVALIDYELHGHNGIDLSHLLKEKGSHLPVVLVTCQNQELMRRKEELLDHGIYGWVFSDHKRQSGVERVSLESFDDTVLEQERPPEIDDLELALRRAYHDHQRERFAGALMQVSTKIGDIESLKDLAPIIIGAFQKHSPEMRLFIREPAEGGELPVLRLLACSENIGDGLREQLAVINPCDYFMIRHALQDGTYWYDRLEDVPKAEATDSAKIISELLLYRGLSFRLDDDIGRLMGTVCMYRRKVDATFDKLERGYANTLVEHVKANFAMLLSRRQGEAYDAFMRILVESDSEDQLMHGVVKQLHAALNPHGGSPSILSKTTYKRVKPGTAFLTLKAPDHRCGNARRRPYAPHIYGKDADTVSARVFRSNAPERHPDITKIANARNVATGTTMHAELCLPVSSAVGTNATVHGIINLESSACDQFTQADEDYALALCRLCGRWIDALQTRRVLTRVLASLSDFKGINDLFDKSIAILREMIGYRLLLFIVRDSGRSTNGWRIARFDGPERKLTNPETREIYFRVCPDQETIVAGTEHQINNEGSTLFNRALESGETEYYVPDVQKWEEDGHGTSFCPPTVTHKDDSDDQLHSQAVFLLKRDEEVWGALSLDFVICNPLTSDMRALLQQFASWLGRLLRDDSVMSKQENKLGQAEMYADMMGQVWHKAKNRLLDLAIDLKRCEALPACTAGSNLNTRLQAMKNHLEQIQCIPNHLRVIGRKPAIEVLDPITIWERESHNLKTKISLFAVTLSADSDGSRVLADPEGLAMVFHHLLDNALDACEGANERQIRLSVRGTGHGIRLDVSDTGHGIPENLIDDIFRPAVSTKTHGTGYGLPWLKRYLRQTGGTLSVCNNPESEGVIATIVLPAGDQHEQV